MSQTHMQRTMSALATLRSHVANLVSGGKVTEAREAQAQAEARAKDAERETEKIVTAVEGFVTEVTSTPATGPVGPPGPSTPSGHAKKK